MATTTSTMDDLKVESHFRVDSGTLLLRDRNEGGETTSWTSTSPTTTTSTSSTLNESLDWPCPDLELSCGYHRRPSWQEGQEAALRLERLEVEEGSSSPSSSSPTTTTTRIHNPFSLSLRSLPPRTASVSPARSAITTATNTNNNNITKTVTTTITSTTPFLNIPQPTQKITFLSPFEVSPHQFAVLPTPAVEAPLSPFCLLLPPGSPFTDMDMDSLPASSPGLVGTPSSMASGSTSTRSSLSGSCHWDGTSSSTRQLAVAPPRQQSADLSSFSLLQQQASSSSSSNTQYLSTSPLSPTKPYYGVRSPSHGNPSSPTTSFHPVADLHINQQQQHDNLQYRRRSVDVGTLGNARGHQRNGRTSQADAPAAAFVPPDQLKAHRARKTNNQRNKEFLFAQHLTSILRHSLSLCSIVAPDADIEAWSNATTPRSSISSISSSGLPSISDRLEPPAPLLRATTTSSSSLNPTPRRIRLPSLPHIVPQRRTELIEMLSTWSFDANQLDLDELCECACIIFECFLESEGLKDAGTPAKWRTFMVSLRAAYHPQNAYHNFAHAVDVLQACYSFVVKLGVAPPISRLQEQAREGSRSRKWARDPELNEKGRIGDILRPMDVLALLVAAIGHDVGHPGLTNAYMINARTPAAQVYNDKSVLENFHSVTLIRMLKIHGFGHLLEDSSENGLGTDFRQVLLTSVLVTDMSRHFPFVEKLTQMGERLAKNGFVSSDVKEDRLVICSALMKCGDISNPSRPHHVASFWSSALLEEWAVQAEIETKFDLPVSVVTLKSDERIAQAKSQVGFINLFTQPLFDKLAGAVPSFQVFADYCSAGRKPWEAIIKVDEERKMDAPLETSTNALQIATSDEKKSALSRALSTPSGASSSVALPEIKIPQYKPAPHRLPWSAKISEFPYDASTPLSPTSTSTFGTSPSTTSSYFKDGRSSPTSSATTFSSSSWIPSNTVEAYHPLAEESCTDNCSSITALCASCARRQRQQWDDADSTSVSSFTGTCATLVVSGQWPPEPFRPSPSTAKA